MTEFTAHPDGTVHGADLAEINYLGYTASSGGRSLVSGAELPGFAAMPDKIRQAWAAGTRAVVREVVRHGELTQALAALRRLADPAEMAALGDTSGELAARRAYAGEVYARLSVAAGQLGLDDGNGAGRMTPPPFAPDTSLIGGIDEQRGEADGAR